MLKEFLSKKKISSFLGKVRIGGQTIRAHLSKNKSNTIEAFNSLFERAVKSETPLEQAIEQAGKTVKTRKRQTLTTLKNIFSAARGEARAVIAGTKTGVWYNVGVLDGKTTEVCAGYMGASWELPYSQIPDKPPRVAITPHPCRSFLVFRKTGDAPPNEAPFMEQFTASEETQRELLGATRFDAFKKGELKITSFAQYEKAVLRTLEELGLD